MTCQRYKRATDTFGRRTPAVDLLWSPLLYLKLAQVDLCGFQCLDAIAAYLDVAMPLLYKVRVVPDVQQVF